MVKISSSGEIIPEDEPRRPAGGASGNNSEPRRRQGNIQQVDGQQPQYAHGPSGSIFTEVNQKLRETGIPSWNIGPYTVEPIVSVAAVIAVLFMGLPGLLIVAVLFFVSKWSEGLGQAGGRAVPSGGAQGNNRPGGNDGGGSGRRWGSSGGGNVLGRR